MTARVGNTYNLSINTTPQLVGQAMGGPRSNRELRLSVTGANSVYYGFVNTVAAANAAVVKNTFTTEVILEFSGNVFAFVPSGTSNLSVTELIG